MAVTTISQLPNGGALLSTDMIPVVRIIGSIPVDVQASAGLLASSSISPNLVLAGPTGGIAAPAAYRQLVGSDLPGVQVFLTGSILGAAYITGASATAITTSIATGVIVGSNIAANTVTGTNILTATILGTNIATATITGSNIQTATILGTNIAATTITGANITALTITTGLIAAGAITGAKIASATITGSNISAATITGSNLAAATITGANITTSTITTGNIAANAITYALLQNTSQGAVLLANTSTAAGAFGELHIAASSLVGVNAGGTMGAITIGSGLSLSGSTLSSTGGISRYTSGQIAISSFAAGTVASVSHGLGAIPLFVNIYLQCITTNNSYSVGDCIPFPLTRSSAAEDKNQACWFNSTTMAIESQGAIYSSNKGANGQAALTAADWVAVFNASL